MSNNNYLDHLMTNQPLETDSISSFSESAINKKSNKTKKVKRTLSKLKTKKKSKKHQAGGDVTESDGGSTFDGKIPNIPHGGFPPLYICDQFKQEDEVTKEREYTTHKNAVSIKDILKTRRDVTPFISI